MDLLWSALSTYGICVWVTVHKDIVPYCGRWHQFVYKLWWVIVAFFSPEFLLLVAVGQLRHAKMIHQLWKERFPDTLGIEGAYFLLMGGYTIRQDWVEKEFGKRPRQAVTLTVKGFERLLDLLIKPAEGGGTEPGVLSISEKKENLRILTTTLSVNPFNQEEIRERGNGNGISKAITICQTGWFVLQCFIRKLNGLPTTLVEVQVSIQILYAVSMFLFWWKKPLDPNEPIEISLNEHLWNRLVNPGEGQGEKEGQPDTGNEVISVPIHSNHTDPSTGVYSSSPIQVVPALKGTPSPDQDTAKSVTFVSNGTDLSPTNQYNKDMLVVIERSELTISNLCFRVTHSVISNLRSNHFTDFCALCLCIIINGALHAISWNAHFPTPTESLLWKLSCVGMVVFTGIVFLCSMVADFIGVAIYGIWKLRFGGLDRGIMDAVLGIWDGPWIKLPWRAIVLWWSFVIMTWDSIYEAEKEIVLKVRGNSSIHQWVWASFHCYTFTMLGGYIICMAYFAVEAFISIRNLPEGAYDLPPGTQIIPHI